MHHCAAVFLLIFPYCCAVAEGGADAKGTADAIAFMKQMIAEQEKAVSLFKICSFVIDEERSGPYGDEAVPKPLRARVTCSQPQTTLARNVPMENQNSTREVRAPKRWYPSAETRAAKRQRDHRLGLKSQGNHSQFHDSAVSAAPRRVRRAVPSGLNFGLGPLFLGLMPQAVTNAPLRGCCGKPRTSNLPRKLLHIRYWHTDQPS